MVPDLRNALKLLPSISTVQSHRLFVDLRRNGPNHATACEQDTPAKAAGPPMSFLQTTWAKRESLDELFHADIYGNFRVSPDGAKLLLDLHAKGQLPKSQRWSGDISLLRAYSRSGAELRKRAMASLDRKAEIERWVAQPTTLPVSEFSHFLLVSIFARHAPEAATMQIGGVRVTRFFSDWFSDAIQIGGRKLERRMDHFTWADPVTQETQVCSAAPRVRDLRHAPERHWGPMMKAAGDTMAPAAAGPVRNCDLPG